jgi:hypothetical protein
MGRFLESLVVAWMKCLEFKEATSQDRRLFRVVFRIEHACTPGVKGWSAKSDLPCSKVPFLSPLESCNAFESEIVVSWSGLLKRYTHTREVEKGIRPSNGVLCFAGLLLSRTVHVEKVEEAIHFSPIIRGLNVPRTKTRSRSTGPSS